MLLESVSDTLQVLSGKIPLSFAGCARDVQAQAKGWQRFQRPLRTPGISHSKMPHYSISEALCPLKPLPLFFSSIPTTSEQPSSTISPGSLPKTCAALNITWSGATNRAIPKAWRSMLKLNMEGFPSRTVSIISEPAVYKLAFRSNNGKVVAGHTRSTSKSPVTKKGKVKKK